MSTTSTEMPRPATEIPLSAVKMTIEHAASVKECLIAGFLQNNEIWSAFNIKRQDVESFFEGVIRDHMFSQARLGEDKCLNTVTLDKGAVTSCKLHYELEDYIEKQRNAKPQEFELFRQLQKAGKQLTKNISLDDYPRGKTVFIDFGGINPAYHVSNLMKVIWFTYHNQNLKRSGYQWVVGRLSNARAMGLYKKFGAKQLSQVTFERDGKKFKLFFFEMDLNSETCLKWQANLDKIIQMEKVQIKQSKL